LLKVGLTGGIACGKSVVGEMFVKLGAHLIEADAIAHWLMEPGRPVYDEVVRRFGTGILNPDRTINRPKLAEAAFGAAPGERAANSNTALSGSQPRTPDSGAPTPPRVKELNAIVHPAVIAHENEWMDAIGARDPNAIAIVEAALILEAGTADRFDYLIVVTCHPEQRIERLARRLELSEAAARVEATRRMAAQMSDDEKIKAADFVIDNSGSRESTELQVRNVFAVLRPRTAS
jgi:dephospho-CoA kinase